MLKVAIIGCGKIADSHASQIQRITGCEIVAVCDQEPLMARQLCDRFPIKLSFEDPVKLLQVAKPDVVHITTPPASHFELAKLCLESGCHVYVEKPFTVDEEQARILLSLATQRKLKITAGHDDQFTHVARRMRELMKSGFLGDFPVHMESYYCYDLGDSAYAQALLGERRHWIHRLPGRLLHNVISHGIARIAEFLTSESPHVIAYGFVSPWLKSIGRTDIVDELRVIISEDERITAYFTFSSQIRPSLHQFRVYGTRNSLVLDHDQETLIKVNGSRLKSYMEKFASPANLAGQYLTNIITNARTFLANDFHMKSGMKYLIESFYNSVINDSAEPITHREILLTARIMDVIFAQLDRQQLEGQAEQYLFPALSD